MTTITWSAIIDDTSGPCVSRCTTQIVSMTQPEPHDAAATAFKWWLEDESEDNFGLNWNDVVEDDETKTLALVVIHEPPEMAGTYAVEAERVITARGYVGEPEDAARAEAILAAAVPA